MRGDDALARPRSDSKVPMPSSGGGAMKYLASGGQEGDLKELEGWQDYAMISRYAKANAGERPINAHKKFSPGDRLNVR